MDRRQRSSHGDSEAAPAAGGSPAVPGKRTLTEQIAARGVAGGGGALPFAETIAHSFGPDHADTVRGIRAHTDGAASAAAGELGAAAYATGGSVAFAGAPDLHTAAHEAAHVVQQRQGVHRKGGAGEAGDPHERHADAVADRVVGGLSAASLLGVDEPAMSASPSVQRKAAPPKHDAKEDGAVADAAPMVWRSLDDVLKGHTRLIEETPAHYQHALTVVWELGGFSHSGKPRTLARWGEAMKDLAPILRVTKRADDYTEADPIDLRHRVDDLRIEVARAEAHARVDIALVTEDAGGAKHAVEVPDDSHPHEQAEVLRSQLPTVISTVKSMMERAGTVGKLVEKRHLVGEELEGSKNLERLESAARVLTLAEGWLKLTDEEFRKELHEIRGVMHGVSTYAELVKTLTEMTSSVIGLTCTVGASIAKHLGKHELAEALGRAGVRYTQALGVIASGIEIIHGAAVMLDSTASREARIDGGAEMGMGIAGLTTTITAGSGVGAMVVAGPYYLAKGAAHLYREASLGWETGFLRAMFTSMQEHGEQLTHAVDRLVAAERLHQQEVDPEKRGALAAEEERRGAFLGGLVDRFLDGCKSNGPGHGVGNEQIALIPGNYQIVAEAFAPLQALRGATTGAAAATASAAVLDKIAWCFNHADSIAVGSVAHMNLAEVEAFDAAEAKKKSEKHGE